MLRRSTTVRVPRGSTTCVDGRRGFQPQLIVAGPRYMTSIALVAVASASAWFFGGGSTTDVAALWASARCQRFFGALPPAPPAQFHLADGVYLPDAPGPIVMARRTATFEDTLNRSSLDHDAWQQAEYSQTLASVLQSHATPISPPLAIRTAVRPVKAWWLPCEDNAHAAFCAVSPFIEKSASTTLESVFTKADGHCLLPKQHASPSSLCEALVPNGTMLDLVHLMVADSRKRPRGRCCISGTFDQSESEQVGLYRFAMVREPLGRFLSGIHSHGSLSMCDGNSSSPKRRVCDNTVQVIRAHAARVAGQTPKSYPVVNLWDSRISKSVHWYTQSYFLSATDASGTPYRWDFIGRLETFEQDLGRVATRLPSIRPALAHVKHSNKHSSDEEQDRELLRRVVLDDPETACNFCRVHAQDYVCLGYDMPVECGACGLGLRSSTGSYG